MVQEVREQYRAYLQLQAWVGGNRFRDEELHSVMDEDAVVFQESMLLPLDQLALDKLAVPKAIVRKGVVRPGLVVLLLACVAVLQTGHAETDASCKSAC